ncbi:cation diffusion facilitator family transporter [Rhodohalobacter sp. 614A]|uniref:cation diffusion facilitator family transporter n=1 Tax=Rhodohalobacter sp. 614A TaxID=2908649 RepID=UPI001F3AD119|nr:cation diffusion facilitator family transporter [Rhodohalobacter sp. 614A]
MNDQSRAQKALTISFLISFLSLCTKLVAYYLTDSTTAMSDAAESVVHVFAVGFVLYGFFLSMKPADEEHLYGHEKIEFLSVGVEGAVIILAAFSILFFSIQNLVYGFELDNLAQGIYLVGLAAIINLFLGLYLKKVGREENNMIVISNGRHVLTDVWTSGGVIFTLFLIQLIGWIYLDTIVSISIALYIFYEGFKLIRFSVMGIMDTRDPDVHDSLLGVLEDDLPGTINSWHHLRHRTSGQTTWVELHLVFKRDVSLRKAHDDATILERKLIDAIHSDAVVTLHLEPEEPHEDIHDVLKGANKNRDLDEFI